MDAKEIKTGNEHCESDEDTAEYHNGKKAMGSFK